MTYSCRVWCDRIVLHGKWCEIKEDENALNVFLEKDGTLFFLYRRTDFEKMTGQSYSYVTGLNGHYEIALSVSNYAEVE